MSRWYLRGFGAMLLAAGGLWMLFGHVFQFLGGSCLVISGLAVMVTSMARSGDVPAETAREIVEMFVDGK